MTEVEIRISEKNHNEPQVCAVVKFRLEEFKTFAQDEKFLSKIIEHLEEMIREEKNKI